MYGVFFSVVLWNVTFQHTSYLYTYQYFIQRLFWCFKVLQRKLKLKIFAVCTIPMYRVSWHVPKKQYTVNDAIHKFSAIISFLLSFDMQLLISYFFGSIMPSVATLSTKPVHHIVSHRSARNLKSYYARLARLPEKFPRFRLKCWMLLSFRTISISI